MDELSYHIVKKYIGTIKLQVNDKEVLDVLTNIDIDSYISIWNSITQIDTFSPIEEDLFNPEPPKNRKTGSNNSKIMSELEQKQYRSKFISYLCQYQIKEKKVYHLNEYLKWDNDNDKYEVAFIFTLPSTNTFYKECYKIIYENINMNRATYIFYIPKDSYKIGINSIIDYFESNNINKRQELQFHRVSFAGIQYYHSVKHTDTFYDWEQYI